MHSAKGEKNVLPGLQLQYLKWSVRMSEWHCLTQIKTVNNLSRMLVQGEYLESSSTT